VRVLTEPSVREDVLATGASYRSFTLAPHRLDRARQSDLVRDFDARTPIGAFAAVRDRVIFGPARAYAQDTMAEIQRFRPQMLAVDWALAGAAVAGEAASVPTALLMHGNNLVPEPGKPPPGFGFLPASSAVGRTRDRVLTRVFLRLFNNGLPALNDARLALGCSRWATSWSTSPGRPGCCACTPRRSTCPPTSTFQTCATSGRCWSSRPGRKPGARRGRRTTSARWWWSA
jgi:hypothetical protein